MQLKSFPQLSVSSLADSDTNLLRESGVESGYWLNNLDLTWFLNRLADGIAYGETLHSDLLLGLCRLLGEMVDTFSKLFLLLGVMVGLAVVE